MSFHLPFFQSNGTGSPPKYRCSGASGSHRKLVKGYKVGYNPQYIAFISIGYKIYLPFTHLDHLVTHLYIYYIYYPVTNFLGHPSIPLFVVFLLLLQHLPLVKTWHHQVILEHPHGHETAPEGGQGML